MRTDAEATPRLPVLIAQSEGGRLENKANRLLDPPAASEAMSRANNPYVDGLAANRKRAILKAYDA